MFLIVEGHNMSFSLIFFFGRQVGEEGGGEEAGGRVE